MDSLPLPPSLLLGGGGALLSFVRWQPLPLRRSASLFGGVPAPPPSLGEAHAGSWVQGPLGWSEGVFSLSFLTRVGSVRPTPGRVWLPGPPPPFCLLPDALLAIKRHLSKSISVPLGGGIPFPPPLALLVGGGGKGAPFAPFPPPSPCPLPHPMGLQDMWHGKSFGVSLGEDGLRVPMPWSYSGLPLPWRTAPGGPPIQLGLPAFALS